MSLPLLCTIHNFYWLNGKLEWSTPSSLYPKTQPTSIPIVANTHHPCQCHRPCKPADFPIDDVRDRCTDDYPSQYPHLPPPWDSTYLHTHKVTSKHHPCQCYRLCKTAKYPIDQGWATYGPQAACSPRVNSCAARQAPRGNKLIWMNIMCVVLCRYYSTCQDLI